METTKLIERTELHDASLIEMAIEGDRVRLRFENVWVDDDDCYRVAIDFGGVSKMLCDNKVVIADRRRAERSGGVNLIRKQWSIAYRSLNWTAMRYSTVRMKTQDGGVIAFRRSGNTADLVVTWTSYGPRTDETHSYKFDFTSFDLRAEKQE